MYPIREARGRAIAFGGRAMDPNDNAKYLNSPETELFDKGRSLYNVRDARTAAGQGKPLIVAEGYMDVIALVQAGFGAAVEAEWLPRAIALRRCKGTAACSAAEPQGAAAAMEVLGMSVSSPLMLAAASFGAGAASAALLCGCCCMLLSRWRRRRQVPTPPKPPPTLYAATEAI